MIPLTLTPWPVLLDVIDSIQFTENPAGKSAYRVDPSPQFVMGFQLEGRLQALKSEGDKTLTPSGVTGIQNQNRLYQSVGKTRSILVHFKPWGAACFLTGPMSELMGENVGLRDILDPQEVRDLEDQLYNTEFRQASRILQAFLVKHRLFRESDPLVLNAAKHIMLKAGNLSISRMADSLATTERSLERRFQQWIGTSPKHFAALLRFQKSLDLLRRGKEGTEVAYECGYFDQAHFIREFKRFTGSTPGAYLFSSKTLGL
jgi:AraC-like DNA-binding protein